MDGENNGKPPIKMDDLGVRLFLETSIFLRWVQPPTRYGIFTYIYQQFHQKNQPNVVVWGGPGVENGLVQPPNEFVFFRRFFSGLLERLLSRHRSVEAHLGASASEDIYIYPYISLYVYIYMYIYICICIYTHSWYFRDFHYVSVAVNQPNWLSSIPDLQTSACS